MLWFIWQFKYTLGKAIGICQCILIKQLRVHYLKHAHTDTILSDTVTTIPLEKDMPSLITILSKPTACFQLHS